MYKNVTIVLKKGFEDQLDLWGVFKTKQIAVRSIESDGFYKFKARLIDVTEDPDYADKIVNEEQDWEAVVDSSVKYPNSGDVWGYLITDRIQTETASERNHSEPEVG